MKLRSVLGRKGALIMVNIRAVDKRCVCCEISEKYYTHIIIVASPFTKSIGRSAEDLRPLQAVGFGFIRFQSNPPAYCRAFRLDTSTSPDHTRTVYTVLCVHCCGQVVNIRDPLICMST